MSIAVRYSADYDHAGEILNDSFLKIFRNIKSFRMNGNFKAWFRKIIIYTAIDHYRSDWRNVPICLEEFPHTILQNDIIEKLDAEDIMNLIRQLPDKHRIVFNLYELEGYTHYEIAGILEISEGTSRSCLSRAKAQLRTLIRNHYEHREKAG